MDSLFLFLYYLTMFGEGISFLHNNHTSACDARVDKHFDGYCSIQFMSEGAVELFYENRRFSMQGSYFWTCYPGPRIRFHSLNQKPWNHRYIAFRGPLVALWQAAGIFFLEPRSCSNKQVRHFTQIFDEIFRCLQQEGTWNKERACNLLEGILLQIAQERVQEKKHEPWLEKVLVDLKGTPFEPNYKRIAHSNGMSLTTLRRRFRESTGQPIHRFVLEGRLAEARRLLGSTKQPIKEITEALGYQDVYFFNRQFKRFYGIPPATYRKSRQM
jgi:AraC-like DNA-binding protein